MPASVWLCRHRGHAFSVHVDAPGEKRGGDGGARRVGPSEFVLGESRQERSLPHAGVAQDYDLKSLDHRHKKKIAFRARMKGGGYQGGQGGYS